AHDVHLQRASLSASDGERAGVRWNTQLLLNCLIADLQADDLFERQNMRAAHVKVRVRRRKPVKVRTADGGEQQRIRLRRDDAVKAWVNGHLLFVKSELLRSALRSCVLSWCKEFI